MIAKWVLVVFLAFNALGQITLINKPCKPVTPESAFAAVIPRVLIIITIVAWWD